MERSTDWPPPASAPPTAASAQPATPSLESTTSPSPRGTQSGSDGWAREAVARAGESRCERSRYVLASLSTETAFNVACRSWACDHCQLAKGRAARELLRRGMRAASERGDELRFLTVTDGSARGTMTVAQLSAAWDNLAELLRAGGPAPPRPPKGSGAEAQARWRAACRARRSYLSEYALVLEVGQRGGRLHAHVILTGRYVPQRKLALWAKRCGFGSVVDIRAIDAGRASEVAIYATKLADYATKAAGALPASKVVGRKRLRVLRTSRGWCEGGFRRVETELGYRSEKGRRDPGPWLLIRHNGAGKVTATRTLTRKAGGS